MADLRYQRTEKLLQDTFLALLKEKPFDELTITQLARAAMVDRTTFYAHYQSLYDLVAGLVDQELAALAAALNEREALPAGQGYDYLFHRLADPVLAKADRLRLIADLPLGRQSFRPRLRELFTRAYVAATGRPADDFTIFLLVNLGLSNFDYLLTHHRAPSQADLRAALEAMRGLIG